jgi:hypothetical protein
MLSGEPTGQKIPGGSKAPVTLAETAIQNFAGFRWLSRHTGWY